MGKNKGGNLQTTAYTDDRVGKEQNPEVANYEKGTQRWVHFSLLFCTVQGKKRITENN